jgi:hypothetical protein
MGGPQELQVPASGRRIWQEAPEARPAVRFQVSGTTFHTDLRGELQDFAKVKDEYFPSDYPAWTAVGAVPELKVEIRAVAVVGSEKTDAVMDMIETCMPAAS